MRKVNLLAIVALITTVSVMAMGCDNRSQLEKDADKAAASMEKAAGEVQKKMAE